MWQIALFAPLIDCSINGEFNALIAASSLLLSPLPVPKPINAIPLSFKVFLTSAKSRCMPFEQEHIGDTCVCCGKPATKMVIWGRQY